MQKILAVIDMQNDFITGALGTPEAQSIVPTVKDKVESFGGKVIFTRDTHSAEYLQTQEGKKLTVEHCIKNSWGWEICDELAPYVKAVVDKPTFGSTELVSMLVEENKIDPIEEIELVGICTDICVISNAMVVKAFYPEIPLTVDARCCAGVTPESHARALAAMKVCQIKVENEE